MATYKLAAAERWGDLPPYIRRTMKSGPAYVLFRYSDKTGRAKSIAGYYDGPNALRDAQRAESEKGGKAARQGRDVRYLRAKLERLPSTGRGGPSTQAYRGVTAYFKNGTRPNWAAKRGTPGLPPEKRRASQQTLFNGPPKARAKSAPAAPKAKSPARKAKPKPKAKPKAPKASGYVVETCTTTRRTFASKAEARAAAKKGSVIRDRSSGEYVSKGNNKTKSRGKK